MKTIVKYNTESTHLYSLALHHFQTRIRSESLPFMLTCAVIPSWELVRTETNLAGHSSFYRIFHKILLFITSKAFVKSIKTWYRFIFCSMHFFCNCLTKKIVYHLPAMLMMLLSLSSRILYNILPTPRRRDIPW